MSLKDNSQDSSEISIFITETKDIANNLRAQINKTFPKIWVYVYNIDNKQFEIKVASNWGGSLDKPTLNLIQNFINENKPKNTTKTTIIKS